MKDISVIIPIYKVEEYIERCVLSVMNQECDGISIECILVDDKSPDRSIDKAIHLIDNYTGDIDFKIVYHEQNQGISVARNTGMKHATGKYVFFMDSDDDLINTCIKKLWNVVVNYQDIQMVMGNYLDKKTGNIGINSSRILKGVISNYQLLELYFLGYIPVMVWNCLIQRDIIANNHLSFKQGLLQEDMLWSSQLFRHIDRFFFLPDVTLNYEYNPKSTMAELKYDETLHIPHQLYIIGELLNTFREDHWVSNTLYVISELLLVLDVIWKNKTQLDDDLVIKAYKYRKFIFRKNLCNVRLILIIFGLVMYKPFGYIVKLKFYRKNYHKIRMAVYKISSIFNKRNTLILN